LWRLYEEIGDGTATAAVLFQSIYNQSLRYVVAGGNAMVFRRHLENGMRLILDRLTSMTTQVRGKHQLAHVAESVTGDHALAAVLGEIFDIVGEYGQLEIRNGRRREVSREYVRGTYWSGGLFSGEMITDGVTLRAQIDNAAILISDLDIEDPRQLVPILSTIIRANVPGLLILADKVSAAATALLLTNRIPGKFEAAAVKTPGSLGDRPETLADLAVMTGGRPILKAAGEAPGSLRLQDLGRARRVWADRSSFGIVGGKGDARALGVHIARLRTAFAQAEDIADRKRLQQRIGRLIGGSAIVLVGGLTQPEVEVREDMVKRASESLRGAIREGVVPGGGVSLLACRPALQRVLDRSADPDEQAAHRVLVRALEEPTRTIIANAGFDAAQVMARIEAGGAGQGFDVMSEQVVDMSKAGIWDSAAVQKAVVHRAITAAGLALTTDVLVHRRRPPETADHP
jgi:chaperonin GroEL